MVGNIHRLLGCSRHGTDRGKCRCLDACRYLGRAAFRFLASVFSILNKKWIKNADTTSITFIEMTSAWLVLSLILPFSFQSDPGAALMPSLNDFILLLVLAIVCTTFAWVLALKALKHVSAFASTLTMNLEPVYGIFLAIFILNEHKELSPGFYWGVLIILAVVFSYPFLNKIMKRKASV